MVDIMGRRCGDVEPVLGQWAALLDGGTQPLQRSLYTPLARSSYSVMKIRFSFYFAAAYLTGKTAKAIAFT